MIAKQKYFNNLQHRNIGHKKLILATNFAETSLTVKDLKYIIDSGFLKLKTFTKLKNNGFLKKVVAFKINNKQRIGRVGIKLKILFY